VSEASNPSPLEVIVARSAGFCFGVTAAIQLAEREKKPVLGPLVHNPEVVQALAEQGIPILARDTSLETLAGLGDVIITAHGAPLELKEALRRRGIVFHDATCPVLLRWVYRKIQRYEADGYQVLLIGNPAHAEVIASKSYGTDIQVAYSKEDIDRLQDDGRPMVALCQTTITRDEFEELVAHARATRFPSLEAVDTRCKPVRTQQEAVQRLSRWVDAMLILGGHNSSNTTKLTKIARQALPEATYHVESPEAIQPEWLRGVRTLGLGAGTSTPGEQIAAAQVRIRELHLGPVVFRNEGEEDLELEDPDEDEHL
jgi:(E)-4-hydroxy-3-methyl-but-2-enyl pyrophosphate reductase